jgi:hypothetical protein
LTGEAGPRTAADAFAVLSEAVQAFGGISYADLGTQGSVAKAAVGTPGG